VPLSAVLAGSVQEVPVERIEGTATLSYELLATALGADTTLAREGDGLRITRTVELFGQTLPLTAVGQATLDGSEVVIDVEQAAGAGVELPDFLVGRASDLLDLRYAVPALPFGLRLTSVTPAADGVVVRLEATDTVVGGGGIPPPDGGFRPGMSGTGAVVVVAALVLTGAAAWWLRARDGAVRTAEENVGSPSTFARLGVRPADADLTVVQFSTAFCGPCRATKARLQQLQTTRPGLAVVHVDAESHLDEVRELDVRRTPTLFYLGRDGTVIGRSSGAPRPDELTALVDAHVDGAP
jgi:thiol-disulfide isomerase/thioredoxin